MRLVWLIAALTLAALAIIYALTENGIIAAICAVALFLVALGSPEDAD